MPSVLAGLFQLRRRSLVRPSLVILLTLAAAVLMSGFPRNHATLWLIPPVLVATAATADTMRCMRPRWNFYHAGVMLCLYMDLMVVAIILFLLIYPYAQSWSF